MAYEIRDGFWKCPVILALAHERRSSTHIKYIDIPYVTDRQYSKSPAPTAIIVNFYENNLFQNLFKRRSIRNTTFKIHILFTQILYKTDVCTYIYCTAFALRWHRKVIHARPPHAYGKVYETKDADGIPNARRRWYTSVCVILYSLLSPKVDILKSSRSKNLQNVWITQIVPCAHIHQTELWIIHIYCAFYCHLYDHASFNQTPKTYSVYNNSRRLY